uniref:MULE transposase domain-containing protein n=1 Tax=Candidatus Methanogaster sp. ANME-2c ERB4 TaxID=2759911 RepID=A0A7G9Y6G9_9EURY|nr:hypothetical protein HMEJMANM_00041 [Methanosarcinales archaeon ANME-2c ERB4]QNO43603.1 hypothetical protein LAPIAFBC_00010 [Methanosarcinales archaeon ANME-2c ERB4]
MPYLHNRDKTLLDSIHYPSWKYLCTIVSFSEASFLIGILQGVKVSSSKLKKIFYENKTLPIRNPIYSQYNGQTIDAIIIYDTKSKRRSGGRPSIKGALGLDLETGEEFLIYLGAVKSWSEVLSHIRRTYNISDEIYAICDGDDNLQQHLEDYGYNIQQCTNHFVKTSMYYLWKEQYPKEERMRIKKEISGIISTLKNSVKKHRIDRNFARLGWRIDTTQKELLSIANELLSSNKDSNTAKFILRTAGKLTLFAELTSRGIQIPDNNNHVENLMGIVGQRIKKNRQSWVDKNLEIMVNTVWQIIS